MNEVRIGDQVCWNSSLGVLHGEVKSIVLARNAAMNLVPWLVIDYIDIVDYNDPRKDKIKTVRLCALEGNFAMMKLKVIFRDSGLKAA